MTYRGIESLPAPLGLALNEQAPSKFVRRWMTKSAKLCKTTHKTGLRDGERMGRMNDVVKFALK